MFNVYIDTYFNYFKSFCKSGIISLSEAAAATESDYEKKLAADLIEQLEKTIEVIDNKTLTEEQKYLEINKINLIINTIQNNN